MTALSIKEVTVAKFSRREGIQLAYPAEEKRILAFPLLEMADGTKKRQFFHQPKLNGGRVRTEWFNKVPCLLSSEGNEYRFLELIQKDLIILSTYLEEEIKYDGEGYVHGWSRERIDSALRQKKSKSDDSNLLEYHIFDVQEEKPQYARLHKLGLIEQAIHFLGLEHTKTVPYGVCGVEDWSPGPIAVAAGPGTSGAAGKQDRFEAAGSQGLRAGAGSHWHPVITDHGLGWPRCLRIGHN